MLVTTLVIGATTTTVVKDASFAIIWLNVLALLVWSMRVMTLTVVWSLVKLVERTKMEATGGVEVLQ